MSKNMQACYSGKPRRGGFANGGLNSYRIIKLHLYLQRNDNVLFWQLSM